MRIRAILRKRTKWLAGCGVHRCASGESLPAPNGDVDQSRIDLDQPGSAIGSLGRDETRTGAAERIEDDPLPIRTVPDRIGHQGDRLDRRIRGKLASRAHESILTRVIPDIASVAAVLAESDMVDV